MAFADAKCGESIFPAAPMQGKNPAGAGPGTSGDYQFETEHRTPDSRSPKPSKDMEVALSAP
ncbi:hypothetical protein BDW74DRAFT_155058 [Aspergillus multicolor]|uniref:uncharacterized protein n=1 Tax=Aspergillus multicolor TaxID=41759 RepID=UPI003CCCB102